MATRYPAELRQRAVELARLREKPIKQLATDLGISGATLHGWLKQTNIDEGLREGLTTDERAEMVRLRRANRVLEMENEILKRAAVDSTGQRNRAWSLSVGVSYSRVFRGRELSFAATASRSSWVRPAMLVPFGKY